MIPLILPEAVIGLLKKFWKPLVVLALIVLAVCLFNHWKTNLEEAAYNRGYAVAQGKYEKEKADMLALQQAEYEKLLVAAQAREQKAADAATAAEKESIANQKKAKDFENRWREALNHVPLSASTDPFPFTVGFVGMYNLAVKGGIGPSNTGSDSSNPSSLPPIDAATISSASGVDFGSGPINLARPVEISIQDLLTVDEVNLSIANQCLRDRETFRMWIKKVCEAGYCKQ